MLSNDTPVNRGDTLTVVKVNGAETNVGITITLQSGAMLTVNANGSYTYNPYGQFESLAAGDTTTDSFMYTVQDDGTPPLPSPDPAMVTIIVTGVNNDAPIVTVPPHHSFTVEEENRTGDYLLSWGESPSSITHYELYEAQNADFSNETLIQDDENLSITITEKQDGDYHYRVRACINKNCSRYLMGTVHVRTRPSSVGALTVPETNDPGTGEFTLTWIHEIGFDDVPVPRYEIEESQQIDENNQTAFKPVFSANGDARSARVMGKIDGTYYYQIRACNDFACSEYTPGSNPVEVTDSPVLSAIMTIIQELLLN